MIRPVVSIVLLAWLASTGVGADDNPIDEAAIVAEIEALVDATPETTPKDRQRAAALVRKGIKAHDEHDYDRAAEFYRKALDLDPLNSATYYELAFSSTRAGDQEAALDAVIRSVALDPKQEASHVLKASILDDLGFRDEAIAAYDALLEVAPESYLGHLNRGITLHRAGRLEDAEAAFLRANEIDPSHPSSYFLLAFISRGRGHDYAEADYLERFVEVGAHDHRFEVARARLEELRDVALEIDVAHPYPAIELQRMLARSLWRSSRHREEFPEALGYEVTFEEDRDVYGTVLEAWRAKKAEDPEAAFGEWDLLLRIDDAGFLEEYIWYHRQLVFGDRATAWMDAHGERVDRFLGWAADEGLLPDEADDPAVAEGDEPSAIDRLREIPLSVMRLITESEVTYQIGTLEEGFDDFLVVESKRFEKEIELVGDDRVPCGAKAVKQFDRDLRAVGTDALIPMLRCFRPGDTEYDHLVRRVTGLAIELDEIAFVPRIGLDFGEDVRVGYDPDTPGAWLMYALTKAAWRREAEIRDAVAGAGQVKRASFVEEFAAVSAAAGAYANSLVPSDPDDPEAEPPAERDPVFDRVLATVATVDHLRGFVWYEVIHKNYGIPLSRLEAHDAQAVSDYLYAYVLRRTEAPDSD